VQQTSRFTINKRLFCATRLGTRAFERCGRVQQFDRRKLALANQAARLDGG
jgi:hypothetical protein